MYYQVDDRRSVSFSFLVRECDWAACRELRRFSSFDRTAQRVERVPGVPCRTYGTHLIGATEQGLAGVHLDQNAAETPHIDGHIVRNTE